MYTPTYTFLSFYSLLGVSEPAIDECAVLDVAEYAFYSLLGVSMLITTQG
jgi:hypothetical protein